MPNGSSNRPRAARPRAEHEVEPSSGNVFADLGVPNPDLALAKAKLVGLIRALIDERGLTQAEAGKLLGLDQPKVSNLVRGRVEGFTLDRLLRSLTALGQRVEISVRPGTGAGHPVEVL